jgi:hypothetical protein
MMAAGLVACASSAAGLAPPSSRDNNQESPAMDQLKPAGLLSVIKSYFFPKQLSVELRTETLESGQVQVTPIFTIDGKQVSAELIKPDKHQNVLGYKTVLDDHTENVHKLTQGKRTRLSKKKAAEFLLPLRRSGVAIRSRDGNTEPRIETVTPDVVVELRGDDTLAVQSELITASGVILDKPKDLEQLRQDDGWFTNGDDIVEVKPTGTPLDAVLLVEGGNGILKGDDVPQFLKELQKEPEQLGAIEKNAALQGQIVITRKPENHARVDGDGERISIVPTCVHTGPQGREYETTPSDIEEFQKKGGGFQRVSEGWTEITPETIRKFQQACEDLSREVGPLENITGTAIPQAISTLLKAKNRGEGWTSPWAVYFSEPVENAHPIVDCSANVEFRINLIDRDGCSLFEFDPIYNHERFRMGHSEVEATVSLGERWVRRGGTWIKVDSEKCHRINAGAAQLDLQRGPNGFRFAASERDKVIELFSTLGSIEHSEAYSTFLLKLADFTKIEDVPLPRNLNPGITLRPYQKHGYNWLAFLHQFGLNGILADDMGLGKTLQTLAVIQRAMELSRSKFPSLIICPTSVVDNWKSEVEKFFSDCAVIRYIGPNRDRLLRQLDKGLGFAEFSLNSRIVVTSYDVARNDHDKLNRVPWLYIVADESHVIKNPDAQRTKAINWKTYGRYSTIQCRAFSVPDRSF